MGGAYVAIAYVAIACVAIGCVAIGVGCGDDASTIDSGVDVRDGAVDVLIHDAGHDAGADAGSFDAGEIGCGCPAFERCEADVCVCADEVLCGTRGHAGFPMVPPSMRTFRVEDDVVIDEGTQLAWQRESASSRPWSDARAYCEALDSGGRDDWRLPARVELASILDASRTPSFDGSAFVGAADYVWTASRLSEVAAYAIYFGQGETVSAGIAVGGGHVRCVAGNREAVPRGTIEATADGEVVLHGGLRWERTITDAMSYADASAACGAGARLPTLYELHDLVDEARARPAIDTELFPSTPAARFWTSTERDFGEILQWVIDFTDGQSALVERSELVHARCVRD